MRMLILLAGVTVLVAGCDQISNLMANPDERFSAGYSDGYAAGFNSECRIRTTLVEGAWNNAHYSRGYRAGETDGRAECRRQRGRS